MSSEEGIGPMGSSVDVGWADGKPRPMSTEASQFTKSAGSRVTESQISGRKPRPRSKNAPTPALTVNYGELPRNQMDNIEMEGATLEDLVMQNAEAIKQFEYLEKSLVSFKETTGDQAAGLRQPGATATKRGGMTDLIGNIDEDKVHGKKAPKPGQNRRDRNKAAEDDMAFLQGAPPVYPDTILGKFEAMNPLSNIYAEGDPEYEDRHLTPLDPIIVEGEGYLYGVRSVQIVALKESVRGNDFVAAFAGPNHTVGITAAGAVYTWGANDMRQLGYAGAEEGILGIDMDPRPVTATQGLVAIGAACGKHHTLVVTEEGQVWSWGAFGNGQLGVGEVSKEKFPHGHCDPQRIQALDTGAPRMVAAGNYHSVIVDGLGDLWTFGSGENGAHGHETQFDLPNPQVLQSVSGLDFRQVACGAAHTIALTASGHIWAWGLNEHGQLGLGDTNNRLVPTINVTTQGKNIRKIACGESHSAFLSDRDVFTFGDGSHGALGHGNSKSQLVPKMVVKLTEDARLRDIDCGPQFTTAISDLGQMYFWGNMKSTSGRGAKHLFNMPRRFKGLEAIYGVACGEHEITALVRIPIAPPLEHKFKAGIFIEEAQSGLVEGYIGRVCSWGRASDGKLGHGAGAMTQADLKSPFAIYGPLYHYSITVVACGIDHSVCITDDGRPFSWGGNREGQLGQRDFKTRLQPTPIEQCCDPDVPRLKNCKNKIFTDVITGAWHCLAITSKKKVYAWGKNKYGQLGLGHTNNLHTPTSILPLSDPLNPKNVRCIAAGKSHSAVITEDGDVYTWGRGWDGQLGHDVITEIELEPRIVPNMENRASASVACGFAHTVVVTDNGNVWAWGANNAGQLGLGHLNQTPTPTMVEALEEQEVTHVACGNEHTVVVTIANEVYGFGNGVYDQLGLGTLGIFPKPQRIPGLTAVPRVQSVVCGANSSAVLGSDDTAYLLGTWDGLSNYVPFVKSKYGAVRKSQKGTTPDVLETPLGIDEVKAIALGPHHGLVIGLEEDRQRLIQRRLDQERADQVKAIDDEGADDGGALDKGEAKPRQLVTPFISYEHGGEPFPDEIENPDFQAKVVAASAVQQDHHHHNAESEYSESEYGEDASDGRSVMSGTSKASGLTAATGVTGISGVSGAGGSTAEGRAVDAAAGLDGGAGHKGFIVVWGNNGHHQLGLCNYDRAKRGKEHKPMLVPKAKIGMPPTIMHYPYTCAANLPSVSTVSCGEYHSMAVCQDGTLWSWGRNHMGQLGHGDTKDHYKWPTQVMALAKKICIKAAAGGQHSLVLTDANKIYAWGNNNFGQLGMNIKDKFLPRPDIVSTLRRSGTCHIVCGYAHSVALLKNEQLYTWGRNDCGQLGLGHYTHAPLPEHVTALKKYQVQQINCGYDHCVAFVAEDKGPDVPPVEKVFSWGRGEEGQLGHNDNYSRCVPKVIRTLEACGVRAIGAGGFASAAIDEAKQVYTWGDCRDGQLGHGDESSIRTPAILKRPYSEDEPKPDVQGTFRSRTVFCGPQYMIAMGIDEERELMADPLDDKIKLDKYSWGSNSHGQLGMPYINAKRRTTGFKKLSPERIPFLSNWHIKEVSCGLEHVMAVVEVATQARPGKNETEEDLVRDLSHLAAGEFEEDVRTKGRDDLVVLESLEDEEEDLGYAVPGAGGNYESGSEFDDEDDMEKLHYPKQIFDRSHVVSPLIIRLGLDDFAELFHDQQITFEAFISLEDDDLIDIGVDTLGARRRIMRAVLELRNALAAPEPPEEEHEDDFDPPEYERAEQEGTAPLKEGHQHHVADFLDDYLAQIEEGEEEEGQRLLGAPGASMGQFVPSVFQ